MHAGQRLSHVVRMVVVLAVGTLLLSACTKVSGGGWFIGHYGEKVTFAFHGMCDAKTQAVKGTLQFFDRAAGVRIHGVVDFDDIECEPTSGDTAVYAGTYTPQPAKAGDGGTFLIILEDAGEPGPSNGDGVLIILFDGIHGGYVNGGTIQGGNIQVH